MSKNIQTIFTQIKDQEMMSPDRDWVSKNKAQMMSQIRNTVDETVERSMADALFGMVDIFVPARMFFVARAMAVFALIISMVGSGWLASVSASSNSLPGDTLYGVKLATERTKVMVAHATGNNEAVTKYHMASAQKRSKELEQVSEEPARVEVGIKELKKSVELTTESLEKTKQDDPEAAKALAKDITEQTKDISLSLKEVSRETAEKDIDIAKEVLDTKKAVTDTGLDAVELLVEESVEGIGEEDAAMKVLVEEKMEEILLNAEDIKLVAEGVSDAVSTTMNMVEVEETTTTIDVVVEEEQLVEEEVIPEDSMALLEEKVHQVDLSVKEADVVVEELRVLLDANDMVGAVEKAKELQDLSSQTEGALVDMVKDVEDSNEEKMVEVVNDDVVLEDEITSSSTEESL
ncbi:MAG: hypothetical protein HOE80_02340 [Candidatus Magasanikbacteria bacterium]|nr:hypothetical protein [Candidatus Magasanikbacteria bacterium]